MMGLLIFWYDIIDDYVFCQSLTSRFYVVGSNGKEVEMYYSPRFEYLCEVMNDFDLEAFESEELK